jgi:hypothetical protein
MSWENRRCAITEPNKAAFFAALPAQHDAIAVLKENAFCAISQLDGLLATIGTLQQGSVLALLRAGYRATSQQIAGVHIAPGDGMMRQHLWKRIE